MGTTHFTALEIAETLTVTGASTLIGNVAIAGTLITTGLYTPSAGISIGQITKSSSGIPPYILIPEPMGGSTW